MENDSKNKTNTFQKLRFLMGNQRFIYNSQSVAFGSYYLPGITLRMEFPKYIRVSSSSYSYTLLELLPEVGGYRCSALKRIRIEKSKSTFPLFIQSIVIHNCVSKNVFPVLVRKVISKLL